VWPRTCLRRVEVTVIVPVGSAENRPWQSLLLAVPAGIHTLVSRMIWPDDYLRYLAPPSWDATLTIPDEALPVASG
jgi:hypothetical protein